MLEAILRVALSALPSWPRGSFTGKCKSAKEAAKCQKASMFVNFCVIMGRSLPKNARGRSRTLALARKTPNSNGHFGHFQLGSNESSPYYRRCWCAGSSEQRGHLREYAGSSFFGCTRSLEKFAQRRCATRFANK